MLFRCCLALLAVSAFAQRPFTAADTVAVHTIGEVAPSPDGKVILFSVDGELMRWAGGQTEAVKGAPKGAATIQWSPDGTRIAFVHDNAVRTLDLRSGNVTRVC